MSKTSEPPTFYEPPVYLAEAEIKVRVRELADRINAEYGMQEITAICTLKGSIVFEGKIFKGVLLTNSGS